MPDPITVLRHNPALVVADALIMLGLGSDPTLSPLQPWPVYYSNEPDLPDLVISTFSTEGLVGHRIQFDGARDHLYGINVRVRGADVDTAGYKARQIKDALDRLHMEEVHMGSSVYVIHAMILTSDPIDNGTDDSPTKRSIFTINTMAQIDNVGA